MSISLHPLAHSGFRPIIPNIFHDMYLILEPSHFFCKDRGPLPLKKPLRYVISRPVAVAHALSELARVFTRIFFATDASFIARFLDLL